MHSTFLKESMSFTQHSYPKDLADFVLKHWDECTGAGNPLALPEIRQCVPSPDRGVLENVLSVCYQTSMVQEEGRTLRFRVIAIDPAQVETELPPPLGLRRMEFASPLPFNERTLRRLAPAASYERSIIGMTADPDKDSQVWGLVHSGSHWLKAIQGLHRSFDPLPAVLVVGVHGPGLLTVAKGHFVLARLTSGQISIPSLTLSHESWLTGISANDRARLHLIHERSRRASSKPWAAIQPGFLLAMMQQNARLIVNAMRSSLHGGLFISIPRRITENPEVLSRYVNMKYVFKDREPRQQFQQLLIQAMNALAEACGDATCLERSVGWRDYLVNETLQVARAKEAISEYARFIADLSEVDGSVVVTRPLEVVGFGGIVSGNLKPVETVARALDADGEMVALESTSEVGTRHRAAYRLCQAVRDAMAVAVSQDGEARMIRWKGAHVTYWDQFSSGLLDI